MSIDISNITFPAGASAGDWYQWVDGDNIVHQYIFDGSGWQSLADLIVIKDNKIDDPVDAYDYAMGVV